MKRNPFIDGARGFGEDDLAVFGMHQLEPVAERPVHFTAGVAEGFLQAARVGDVVAPEIPIVKDVAAGANGGFVAIFPFQHQRVRHMSLGDVLHDACYFPRHPAHCVGDDLGFLVDDALRTVGQQNPMIEREPAGDAEGVAHGAEHPSSVVRMHGAEKGAIARLDLTAFAPKNAIDLVRPGHPVFAQIFPLRAFDLPAPEVCEALGRGEICLAYAQGLLGLLAQGDVALDGEKMSDRSARVPDRRDMPFDPELSAIFAIVNRFPIENFAGGERLSKPVEHRAIRFRSLQHARRKADDLVPVPSGDPGEGVVDEENPRPGAVDLRIGDHDRLGSLLDRGVQQLQRGERTVTFHRGGDDVDGIVQEIDFVRPVIAHLVGQHEGDAYRTALASDRERDAAFRTRMAQQIGNVERRLVVKIP